MLVRLPQQAIDVDSILRANAPTEAFLEGTLPPWVLAVNLTVGTVVALVLQRHYRRYSTALSGQEQFAGVFPFITLTTLLIITIVKSSLALSLGLVGALSIVRFRTPIKEPQELAYLFVCIAVGLGLGANQTIPTVGATAFILVITAILSTRALRETGQALYFSITLPDPSSDAAPNLQNMSTVLASHVARADLRRFDAREGLLEANYLVHVRSPDELTQLVKQLQSDFPEAGITFIDQSRLPTG